ncbi:hypothetical protein PAE9249_04902 [Paenibacillus sp. CECT 9249]|uniref:hypothetical protein n=1 Tax=Paenibacillus sp. CECT 9249 TaxID=2845385 RepID=UPI001E3D5B78|nr:hypothetical protein [Paenibacillus sp. CECT 9249]CAH0122352.1 hypothetical protein PAE9249_04902 [Paenibacillus sp. CECT 9249]
MNRKWSLAIIILVTVILVNSIIFFKANTDKNNEYEVAKMGTELSENIGEITPDVLIEQSFISDQNDLSQLNLFFSTFNRLNNGETIIQLLDGETKEIIRKININNEEITDNDFFNIKFDPITNSKNRKLILNIKSYNTDSLNAVTIWIDRTKSKNSGLKVNGLHEEGSIVFDLIYENKINLQDILWTNVFFVFLNILISRLFIFLKR